MPRFWRTSVALLLAVILSLPHPAWALRTQGVGSATVESGLEEALREIDPQFLDRLTRLARTFTGDYKLQLRTWEALWEGDWPQWRYIPSLHILQYAPEDFKRYSDQPDQVLLAFLMEAVAAAIHLDFSVVDPPLATNGAFLALLRATGIPWARARVTARLPGMQADFVNLDTALYSQKLEAAQGAMGQLPLFLQFLEGILYEGRRQTVAKPGEQVKDERIVSPEVREALDQTRLTRQKSVGIEFSSLYRMVRDDLWPVAERLLQFDPRMRDQRLEETVRQMAPKFPLAGVIPQGLLSGRPGSASPEAMGKLHEDLQRRAEKVGQLARDLSRAAQEIVGEAKTAEQSAGGLGSGAQEVRHAAGAAPIPSKQLENLTQMSQILQKEVGDLCTQAQESAAQAKQVPEYAERLSQLAPGPVQKLRDLAHRLPGQFEQIEAQAKELTEKAERLPDQAQALAKEGNQPKPDVSTLRDLARSVQEQAASVAQQAGQIQDLAQGAESTAGAVARESKNISSRKSPQERIFEAARSIAEWANPELKKQRQQAEAMALTLRRILQELAQGVWPQAQAQGKPELAAEAKQAGQDAKSISGALHELLQMLAQLAERLKNLKGMAQGDPGVPLQVILIIEGMDEAGQQAGRIQAQVIVIQSRFNQLAQESSGTPMADTAQKLSQQSQSLGEQAASISEGIRQAGQQARSQAQESGIPIPTAPTPPDFSPGGLGETLPELIGEELLKVLPPAAPKPAEVPLSPVELGDMAKLQREFEVSPQERRGRERQAVQRQQEQRKVRKEALTDQRDRYRRYVAKRLSLISVARAHLFQSVQMRETTEYVGGLREGDDLDEEELPLASTGWPFIFQDVLDPGKVKQRRSFLLDVSGSMQNPVDWENWKSQGLDLEELLRKKKEAVEKEERKIDHALDLLVTLAEAVAPVPGQQFEITLFSNWTPNASIVVKRFDEKWDEQKAAFVVDQALNLTHGGTDDVGAVAEEMARLREGADTETEKILWVISDGLSGAGGASAMAQLMEKNPDIRIFGWGLGPAMAAVKQTYGPYGIHIPQMHQLVRKGIFTMNQEMRRPVRPWKPSGPSPQAGPEAGLEEVASERLPLAFPRLSPFEGLPGAGELLFHRQGDQAWFEIDGIRIDPPNTLKIELSDWTVLKLKQMWDVLRHPTRNNLLLIGQAGIGKSLYARYIWEIYRGWLQGKATQMTDSTLATVRSQLLNYVHQTRVRVVTFNENMRKPNVTERLSHRGEEMEWSTSDIVEGGELGDLVILSEVNRAPGSVLAELNDPLQSRVKVLHDRVARFHPNSRFVAAINPPEGDIVSLMQYKGRQLPGEFLTRFGKLRLDYPSEKLADGKDNLEFALFQEHERQILRQQRRRKTTDGDWVVSDGIIDGLLEAARLLRADARQAESPFVVTTRALVRMVRHLDTFPEDLARIPDIFFKSYWVDDTVHGDGMEQHVQDLLERVFKPTHWPAGQPWPAARSLAVEPIVVPSDPQTDSSSFIRYPHWPADVRISLATGTGGLIPTKLFRKSAGNLRKLEDLLKSVALGEHLLNIGDAGTGKNYFMEILARTLKRNLIVLGMSKDFKVRDMLVIRWYEKGKTLWRDSLPLAYLRPDRVAREGPPIVVWDEGNKALPGTLAAFNDFLAERRVLMDNGEEFVLPEGAVVGLNMNPPRPPYEVYELSAEFVDRWAIHRYGYPEENDEVAILREDHPTIPEEAIRSVVKAANVLRPLFRQGELYEPPDMRLTEAAVGNLSLRPDQSVPLIDLILRTYVPLKEGEPETIRKALQDAKLDIQVNPSPEAALRTLIAKITDPDVAARREAAKLGLGSDLSLSPQLVPALLEAFSRETDSQAKTIQAAALGRHLPAPTDTQKGLVLTGSFPDLPQRLSTEQLKDHLYRLATSQSWAQFLEVVDAFLSQPDDRLRSTFQRALAWQRLDSNSNPIAMPGDLYSDPRMDRLLTWLSAGPASGLEEEPTSTELIRSGRQEFGKGTKPQRAVQAMRLYGGKPADWLGSDDTKLAELTGRLIGLGIPADILPTEEALAKIKAELEKPIPPEEETRGAPATLGDDWAGLTPKDIEIVLRNWLSSQYLSTEDPNTGYGESYRFRAILQDPIPVTDPRGSVVTHRDSHGKNALSVVRYTKPGDPEDNRVNFYISADSPLSLSRLVDLVAGEVAHHRHEDPTTLEAGLFRQLVQSFPQLRPVWLIAQTGLGTTRISQIPVLAGFLLHGDDPLSMKVLEEFKKRLDGFLSARPGVKHLVVPLEVGGPFLTELLQIAGLQPGDLIAAARRDPQGVDQIVRPAFHQAMEGVNEFMDGWVSQIRAGSTSFNPPIPSDWNRRLFEILVEKQKRGINVVPLREEPSFESWWRFLLARERENLALQQVKDPSAESQVKADLLHAAQEKLASAYQRDDVQIGLELISALKALMYLEEDPEPESTVMVVPRGRMHAFQTERLLKGRFSNVEMVRMEELDTNAQLRPIDRYVEALVQRGVQPGAAPADVERLVDEEIAQLRGQVPPDPPTEPKTGLEELSDELRVILERPRYGPTNVEYADQKLNETTQWLRSTPRLLRRDILAVENLILLAHHFDWPHVHGALRHAGPAFKEAMERISNASSLSLSPYSGRPPISKAALIRWGRREFVDRGSKPQRAVHAMSLYGGNPADWLGSDDTKLAELTGRLIGLGVEPSQHLEEPILSQVRTQLEALEKLTNGEAAPWFKPKRMEPSETVRQVVTLRKADYDPDTDILVEGVSGIFKNTREIRLFQGETGELIKNIPVRSLEAVNDVAQDLRNRRLFVAFVSQIRTFDPETGQEIAPTISTLNPSVVVYDADDNTLLVPVGPDLPGQLSICRLLRFDATTGEQIGEPFGEYRFTGDMAYVSDRKLLFVTDDREKLRVYDMATEPPAELPSKALNEPTTIHYDPESDTVLVKVKDGIQTFSPDEWKPSAGLEEDMVRIARVLATELKTQPLIGIGPSGLKTDGPELIGFLDRLKAQVPALGPFLVVIGPEAPSYADHPSVLLAAGGLEEAAGSLALLGAGRMGYLDTEDGAEALNRLLQSRGVPITVTHLPMGDLPFVLKRILGNLAGLEEGLSQSEVESFYGIRLNKLADHLKELAKVSV